MNKYIYKIKNLLSGYLRLFQYLYSSNSRSFSKPKISLNTMVILLGLIGILRNLLEVYIGGKWANEWFALKGDVLFTMFFGLIFLCFFSTTLLHFFSNKFGLKVNLEDIFSIIFYLQVLHLIIPFFDGLADLYNIPFRFYFNESLYKKLIFSPLAFTPLIMFFTWPTSLGIDIAWIFTALILVKFYTQQLKFPMLKSLIVLSITFYIVYMAIYPTYSFFLRESIIGSNYIYGLFFMFMSIPSIIYVKMFLKRKKT